MNAIQLLIPMLDVRAVRRLLDAGDGCVTLVRVRTLAQRQLNCAWVLGIVIYLHVASMRVLRCFFGDDSA